MAPNNTRTIVLLALAKSREKSRDTEPRWDLDEREEEEMAVPFQFPPCFEFPPFFTLQPAQSTRVKQLELWQKLVLDWAQHHKEHTISVAEWPHFGNPAIQRRLPADAVSSVVQHMIGTGHAEYEDDTRARVHVYWRRPADWAAIVYDFARGSGMIGKGRVYTVYELRNDEDAPFCGMEAWLLLKALRILEEEDKARLITPSGGIDDIENYGAKFKDE